MSLILCATLHPLFYNLIHSFLPIFPHPTHLSILLFVAFSVRSRRTSTLYLHRTCIISTPYLHYNLKYSHIRTSRFHSLASCIRPRLLIHFCICQQMPTNANICQHMPPMHLPCNHTSLILSYYIRPYMRYILHPSICESASSARMFHPFMLNPFGNPSPLVILAPFNAFAILRLLSYMLHDYSPTQYCTCGAPPNL